MSTSGSRTRRTLFLVALSALLFGLIAPIAPAAAATDFTTPPQVYIDDDTPTVGDVVAAVLDPASVPAADAYAYQWYTVDGSDSAVEVAGATGETYAVTASDAGLELQVRITASKAGYNDASHTSYRTDAVRFDFASGPQVSISDTTPTVDQTISAVVNAPSVPAGTYTYQWYWAVGTDPTPPLHAVTPLYGETDAELTVPSKTAGHTVLVLVTATKTDYNEATDWSTASVVAKADFSSGPAVAITGTPRVGELLTANVSGLTPEADWYTYEWKANGISISPHGDPTYTLRGDEADKKMTVTVTAFRSGYNTTQEVTSAPTAAVERLDFTKPPTVTITGTAKVGEALWAKPTGELPAGDDYIYTWRASGTDIGSGPGPNHAFVPTVAELGKTITVTVTATKLGFNYSAEATSAPTAAVVPTFPTANLSTTAPKVGTVLTVTPTGASPAADSYAYQWYRISPSGSKSPILGATGQSYTVPIGALNYKLQVKVTAITGGYRVSASSVQTARVNQIILDKTSVTRGQSLRITGKRLRVGQVYRMFIDGKTVYKGKASSTGTALRTVTVPTSISTGTKRVWVSGYNSAGVRDFQVLTTVVIK